MQLTNLFFDGVNQVDVVLRDQRDGHSVPPCRRKTSQCMSGVYVRREEDDIRRKKRTIKKNLLWLFARLCGCRSWEGRGCCD